MSFAKHVEILKLSCLKKMNLILSIYDQKVEYGPTIYGRASEGQLNKLEVIQNTAIKIAFRAKQTTSILFLLIESGLEKLSTRRDVLILKYIQKLWTSDKNHSIKRHFVTCGLFNIMNPNRLSQHLNPFEKAEALMREEGLNFSIARMLQYKKPHHGS
ncbi:hypothetical protein QYM36_014638 [Artemia franciscana]|uniref:Uncharacterized protein n=1 Tax=Artemia franciscana TaxID=6661 RepID=A0AA88HD07_ARTSF|nr:hypothetical protein QYM36_014638 [Artemia franciscana]